MHKRVAYLLLVMGLGLGLLTLPSLKASAVTGADWQAGRIIDDSVFTDKNSMTAQQIQDFLNAKAGTGGYGRVAGQCDTNGVATSELGGGTRAQYGSAHNNPAPFTCLKDYYEVPKTAPGAGMPANNYGGKPIPAGAESAAQLIWDAAQRYNISPKVLLVTIQKESAGPLTTDDWPFASQYTYAMGAHCPDSGPGGSANCDPSYAGFSIQISESAALFRYYLDNMTQSWWPYKKIGINSIQYDVSTTCNATNVNIVTMATAALYTYTPYQPNPAALANLYGTGDGCSAYGNRNFWRIFNDWFGNTVGPNYQATILSSILYSNSTRTNLMPKVSGKYILTPGQKVYAAVQILNSGRASWDSMTHLGTSYPQDRSSVFNSTDWLATNRPASLASNPVAPGSTGTFNFSLTAPQATGNYREDFSVVDEGAAWTTTDIPFLLDVSVPVVNPLVPSTAILDSSTPSNMLAIGGTLLSPDGYTSVAFSNNGPLTLRNDFLPTWSIDAAGPGARLVMQNDGNLVVYRNDGSAAWSSGTDGKGPSKLVVQDDGNLVIYNGSGATWSSNTSVGLSHYNYTQNILPVGAILRMRQKSQTADRNHTLSMQTDGNLVLYRADGRPVWASNTDGKGASYLSMQTDGNLVLYRADGRPVWASNTDGKGASPSLYTQADGNLVIYTYVGAIWASNTSS